MLVSAPSDAPHERLIARAFIANDGRSPNWLPADNSRRSSRPDCSGHKKLTRRPLADPARTTCIVGRNTEGDWVMKLKLAVAALALVIATPTFAADRRGLAAAPPTAA
jgi:hypothetical protein